MENTHKTLSKNFVPGETFADIANIIVQNEMKNAFIISLIKENEIHMSSGFTIIK